MKKNKNYFLLSALLVFCNTTFADNNQKNLSTSVEPFKVQPRINLRAMSGDRTFGDAQVLVPVFGDQNGLLYGLVDGNYVKNKSSWLVGAGLGYRKIVDDFLFGSYLIVDYAKTPQKGLVILNPGVEALSDTWDFSVNGYIPTSNHKTVNSYWLGDDLGNYRYTRASGHNYYDHLYEIADEPNTGVSIDIARVMPFNLDVKGHVGGYYFSTKSLGSTKGVTSKITYDLNKYSGIEVGYNYDQNRKNQLIFGLTFTLGGYTAEEKQTFGLATRLLDPIVRNEMYYVPTQRFTDEGEALQHDNVWFFKSGTASSGSGTAEDPFVGFTPTTFNKINPNIGNIDSHPLMFFASGNYTFDGFYGSRITLNTGLPRDVNGRFVLPAGWGMYGKDNAYKAPAMDDNRPKFTGGIDILNGIDAISELNSIYVFEDESNSDWNPHRNPISALYIVNGGTVNIVNSKIENDADKDGAKTTSEFVYGIYSENSVINFNALNTSNSGKTSIIAKDDPDWTSTNHHNDYTQGINSIGSTINFNAGIVDIISQTEGAFAHSMGINSYHDEINFNGGNINISSMATGLSTNSNGVPSYSYGMRIDSSIINLKSSNKILNIRSGIKVNGETNLVNVDGIYANKETRFYAKGDILSNNLDKFMDYMTIDLTQHQATNWQGNKVIFGDNTLAW